MPVLYYQGLPERLKEKVHLYLAPIINCHPDELQKHLELTNPRFVDFDNLGFTVQAEHLIDSVNASRIHDKLNIPSPSTVIYVSI